jgi:hypothetical protein
MTIKCPYIRLYYRCCSGKSENYRSMNAPFVTALVKHGGTFNGLVLKKNKGMTLFRLFLTSVGP